MATASLKKQYRNPTERGSLGGTRRFARSQKESLKAVHQVLEEDIAYTLHKAVRRRHFSTCRVC